MKRIALFVAEALAIVFVAALVNVNKASNQTAIDVHAIHNHGQDQHAQHQPNSQQKKPVVDGAVTPDAIPDHSALAIVFRLLSSDEPDRIGDRKKAYLRHYGFNDDAQAALMLAARDYKRLVAPIEMDVNDIKNLTWPNPDNNTRNKLKDLQRQKEAVIASVSYELNNRLRNYNSLDKWTDHIANKVKRKIKGHTVELPTKKIGFFQLFPDPFAAYAQGGGCDPVYAMTDGVNDDYSRTIYAYTGYDAGANNCGHEFYPTTFIYKGGVQVASGIDYADFNLYSGQGYYDGWFNLRSDIDAFCPVVSQLYNAAEDALNMFVPVNVTLNTFGSFSSGSRNCTTGNPAYVNISISVTGSTGFLGNVTVTPSYEPQGAPTNMSISITNNAPPADNFNLYISEACA